MKNKNTTAILAIFTGIIGGHHFYLGRNFWGIMSIIACFIFFPLPLLAGVIEGFWVARMGTMEFHRKYNPILMAKLEEETAKRKAEEARREFIINKYGEEIGSDIVDGNVWRGMTKEMLLDSLGEPDKVKQDVSRDIIKNKFFYGKHYTSRGTEKFIIEIRLEEDEVVGWKDLA